MPRYMPIVARVWRGGRPRLDCKFADDLRPLEDLAEMRTYMCPAGLYGIPESRRTKGAVDQIVNYTNCMRCGQSRPWAGG
jgi:ferredoxin-like protein FixX